MGDPIKKEPRPKMAETPAQGAAAHFAGRPINRKNLARAKAKAMNNRKNRNKTS